MENTEHFVSELLASHAKAQPEAIAIESETFAINYLQLEKLVYEWERVLVQAQLPAGVCVGLRFQSQLNYLLCHIALLKLGITQVMVDCSEPISLQEKTIQMLEVDLVIHDSVEASEKLSCPSVDISTLASENFPKIVCRPKTYPEDSLLVFWGSGTTGNAKIIALSSQNYLGVLQRGLQALVAKNQERYFCCSRLKYTFPRRQALLCLSVGACVVVSVYPIKDLVRFVRERKVEHLLLTADQAHRYLLKSEFLKSSSQSGCALPELKSLQIGSSLIKQPLRKALLNKITPNLFVLYGANEFGIVSIASPEDVSSVPGTVGKVIPGVKVKILSGREHGEVLLKSEQMIQGYVNNPVATQKSFAHKGWYQPNDIGYFTKNGQLVIEGRSDDAMIFRGSNIYPGPLEEVLESHFSVREAAVFPISIGELENIPIAVITVDEPIEMKLLLEHCDKYLGWKRPQHIFVMDELPRNSAGKVLKRRLIEIVQSKVSVKKLALMKRRGRSFE